MHTFKLITIKSRQNSVLNHTDNERQKKPHNPFFIMYVCEYYEI